MGCSTEPGNLGSRLLFPILPGSFISKALGSGSLNNSPSLIFRLLLKDPPVGLGRFTVCHRSGPTGTWAKKREESNMMSSSPTHPIQEIHQSPHGSLHCPQPLAHFVFLPLLQGPGRSLRCFSPSTSPPPKLSASQTSPPTFAKMPKRGHVQVTGPSQSASQGCAQMSSSSIDICQSFYTHFHFPSQAESFPSKELPPSGYSHNSAPVPMMRERKAS